MSEPPSSTRKYTVPEYVSLSDVRDGTVVLITPRRTRELHGSSVHHLKRVFERLRDGGSVETLTAELDVPPEQVRTCFAALDELGVLEPVAQSDDADAIAWIANESDEQGCPSTESEARNRSSAERKEQDRPTVAVHDEFDGMNLPRFDGVTVTERETLDEALDAASADLLVTLTPAVYPSYHRRVLDESTSRGTPWLPVRFAGDEIRIGPLHHSAVEGCFDCHYRRLVRSVERPDATLTRDRHVEATGETIPYTREAVRLGVTLAVTQARRFLEERGAVTADGSVLYVDLDRTTTELGDVIPVGGCQVCELS